MAGMVALPALRLGSQRRSPVMSWYLIGPVGELSGLTTIGWTTPEAAMDWVSSVSWASSKRVRVWKGLRSIWSRGISSGFPVGSATAVITGTVAGAGRD